MKQITLCIALLLTTYGSYAQCDTTSDCSLTDDTTGAATWNRPLADGGALSNQATATPYDAYGPFIVDITGDYTFTNTYTGYDGFMFIYSDCFDPEDQFTNFVAGNDDFNGTGQSQLAAITLTTGTEYYIITTGFDNDDFGEYTLELTTVPAGATTLCGDAIPPPNDLIENAIDVDELGFPYTDTDINFPSATVDILTNTDGCNATLNSIVWYKFTAFADGTVTATFESPTDGTDSLIIFYSADDENATNDDLTFVNSGTNICANANNHTNISIEAVAGQTYYMIVNSLITSTITIDSDTVLSTEENTIEGFSFFPNPVEDILNVNATQSIDQVSIYNINGQKIVDQHINATNSQLQVGHLTTGIYLMTITSGDKSATYKMIKK